MLHYLGFAFLGLMEKHFVAQFGDTDGSFRLILAAMSQVRPTRLVNLQSWRLCKANEAQPEQHGIDASFQALRSHVTSV